MEQRWLELVYKSVADCLFLLSVEPEERYSFVSVNDAFLSATGLTREQIVGKRVEEVIPESAHALVLGKYREAIDGNKTLSWEEVSDYPTGKRVGEVKITPFRDEANGQLYLAGAVRDVTTLREEEQRLRRNEELLRALLRSFPNGSINVLDRDLRYVIADGEGLRQVNLTSEGLVGRTLHELFPKELVDLAAPHYQRTLKGETTGFEFLFENNTYDIKSVPLRNEVGEVYAALAVAMNVTEKRRLEEKLKQSQAELRAVFNNARDAILLADDEARYVEVSPAACELLGYSREEMLKLNIWDVTPSSNREEGLKLWRKFIAGGNLSGEYVMIRKDGTPVEVEFNSVANILPGLHLTINRDITARKRADEILRESEAAQRSMAEQQSAILDALPAHIALLDGEGTIVAINASWRRFAVANAFQGEDFGVGSNYLEVAEHAQGDCADEAEHVAQGIRAVLAGESSQFELEYPCHSPDKKRWFRLMVTPLRETDMAGVVVMHINITERRAAAEAMRESERRYRNIIGNAPLTLYMFDSDGVFTLLEGRGLDALGLRPGELVGRSAFEIYGALEVREHTGKISTGSEVLRRILGGETIKGITHVSGLYFENSFIPMRDASDQVVGIMGVSFDITETMRAEEELRRSEERFRSMIEHGSDIISLHDADGQMAYQSPSVKRILGYEQDELVGRSVLDFIHPQNRRATEASINDVRSSPGIYDSFETRFLHKNGEWCWFECIGNNQLDNPAVGKIIFSARDITARKQAEEHLQAAERRFRSVVECMGEGLLITDFQDNVIYANPRLTQLTGYSAEEMMGRPAYQFLLPEEMWDEILQKNKQRREGADDQYELQFKRKDGSLFWAETNASPFRDAKGEIVGTIGLINDITVRKQSEEALRASEEQLRQSQKLESVGLLAGGIAHDFNNMLTAINGYSELILRQLEEGNPLRQKVEEIKKAGERAGALTYQLLAFSRKQILQPKTLNVNEIVLDVSKMLQRLIGEDIDLRTVLNEHLGQVEIDPGQITQVIMNLAVNARDAMPAGGKLTIETDNVSLDEIYARSHVSVKSGRYVLLAVSDNGSGIDAETQKRIFEPFFTTKAVGKGTGMGLATVYGIVKQSGGNIWAYSEVGQGTTFKIYLPRVDANFVEIDEETLGADLPTGTEKILLVEDEEIVRNLTRQILEMCGYEVVEAMNGNEALKLCEGGCEVDLLITDVVMPQMGGRELVRRLADLRPALRVIYTSGYTDNAIVHHGALEEGTNFIQKPFTPESFAKKVREVLDS